MANHILKKNNRIWILSSNSGLEYLVLFDINTGIYSCEYVFDESTFGKSLFSDMILVNDVIVFVPKESEYIYIWSIDERKMKKRRLKGTCLSRFDSSYTKFTNAASIGENIYFFPHKYSSMLKYNVFNDEEESIDVFNEDVLSKHVGNGGLFERGAIRENIAYLLCNGSNNICMYDLEKGTYSLNKIAEDDIRVSDICYDGYNYWISDNKDRILKWDISTNTINPVFDYKIENIEKSNDNAVWNKNMVAVDGWIWVFSYSYPIIRIDKSHMTHEIVRDGDRPVKQSKGLNYIDVFKDDKYIYALQQSQNVINVFDVEKAIKTKSYSTLIEENQVLSGFIKMIVES